MVYSYWFLPGFSEEYTYLLKSFFLFVATKIEFYVGDVPDGLSDQWKNAVFKRLG